MASIAFREPGAAQPKRVSGWTAQDRRIARTIAAFFHDGVGEGPPHVERSRFVWCWRRKASWPETLALPDVGIAGDYKRRLIERGEP